ncbi:MAG TPA: DUF2760 domain-containing protein [Pirellulales bacterium]|nr:DUF2760 domain-containing protein [Pirellulales bacterium]
MGRIGLAVRVFFRVLFDAALAQRVRPLLSGEAPSAVAPPDEEGRTTPTPTPKTSKKPPGRSDALNLLAMLQREARLVDFIQEPIAGYSDEQIGAAVRDVHRDCAAVFERVFALVPIRQEAEGSTIELSGDFDAAQFRLAGRVPEQPPFRGTLAHHGWRTTQCVLPEWNGSEAAATVIAPAVMELS